MSKQINYLHVEISTLCNAACPCCPRFNKNSPLLGEGLKAGYVPIKKFKEWFPPEVLSRVNFMNFCGNHGDPGTNPDFAKIVKYLSKFSIKKLQFHSNGGMRTPKHWKAIAAACNECSFEIHPIFSVDGLEDTNHLYRRNVKWDKLMANMKAFIKEFNKPEYIIWDYLVFKHNQHQIGEAQKLADKMGIGLIQFKHPINLDDGENITPIPSLASDGSVLYWIDPSDLKRFKPSYLSKDASVVYPETGLNTPVKEWYDDKPIDPEYIRVKKRLQSTRIVPRCMPNDLYVETDGTVHQCCFVANGFYLIRDAFYQGKYINPIYRQYLTARKKLGEENLNLNSTSIDEIEENKTLKKLNTFTWDKSVAEGRSLVCADICGKKQALDEIYETQPKRVKA